MKLKKWIVVLIKIIIIKYLKVKMIKLIILNLKNQIKLIH
jgi:hypothetical protein